MSRSSNPQNSSDLTDAYIEEGDCASVHTEALHWSRLLTDAGVLSLVNGPVGLRPMAPKLFLSCTVLLPWADLFQPFHISYPGRDAPWVLGSEDQAECFSQL